MRLLVLDGSRILASLVRRLAPEPVDIEIANSFEEAVARLMDSPPDALIANITPADLPWQELKSICQSHEPAIPVIFESCVFQNSIDAGIGSLGHSAVFLPKPYDLDVLRVELARLFGEPDDLDLESVQPGLRPPP